jgi:hypothetical protein
VAAALAAGFNLRRLADGVGICLDEDPRRGIITIAGRRFEVAEAPCAPAGSPRRQAARDGILGAAALADMFELYRTHVGARPEDLAASRRLYPGLRDFTAWALANGDALRTAMDA